MRAKTDDARALAACEGGDLWLILLAAGDGTRVHGLVSDRQGVSAPKQYCTLDGRESMLRWSVNRALGVVPSNRIVPVVAAQHRRWWMNELIDLPQENIVVQPRNRGTAAGILLPLLRILQHDRRARVLILPSDHYVSDERRLRRSMIRAVESVESGECRVVLLGIVPDDHDSGYGWIVPVSTAELALVEKFVEKPDHEEARSLMNRGALLNSFIIAAEAATLLQLYDYALPQLLGEFVCWMDDAESGWSELATLYGALPSYDFSKEVLERSADYLSTVCVSECGWSDLGTPQRLRDYLKHRDTATRHPRPASANDTVSMEMRGGTKEVLWRT